MGVVAIIAAVTITFVRSRDDDSGSPPAAASAQVDGQECPSVSPITYDSVRHSYFVAHGPVALHFPRPAVGPDLEVFAHYRTDKVGKTHPEEGIKQKAWWHIDAPIDTRFSVHGNSLNSDFVATWEGPTRLMGEPIPLAERSFVPGGMTFQKPGCHQIFVTINGVEYGPFVFVVRSGNPGEIVPGS